MRRKKNQLPFSLRRQITELLTSLPNLHDSASQQVFVYSADLDLKLQTVFLKERKNDEEH